MDHYSHQKYIKEDVRLICPVLSILRVPQRLNPKAVDPCLKEGCAWWITGQEGCAMLALGDFALMKMQDRDREGDKK